MGLKGHSRLTPGSPAAFLLGKYPTYQNTASVGRESDPGVKNMPRVHFFTRLNVTGFSFQPPGTFTSF